MNQNKFMLGSPVLMGDKTIPGVPMPEDLKRLLPEIFRKVSEFGCDFPPTVVEMLTTTRLARSRPTGAFPSAIRTGSGAWSTRSSSADICMGCIGYMKWS